ncbi:tRNA (guanosine(46)-N7)-methyltransferase TrmB [Candidatus Paracaedibacter symbiosus]|uniref:tRNA (guanosine(46)-N7)-methyltransferase TrmB n=1 Tax=Candidatus Paracaedibacter symbiosus TaxID=244582 RepID=UPI000509A9A8|nr:tRNA (guanosine(46)-N7)-methyltransferase TrmB [Candidatus Paracaedibacter symbiosus]
MHQEYRKIWGRRQSRPLKDYQKNLSTQLLPQLEVKIEPGVTIDPLTLFSTPKADYHLEIGFGGGEHLAARALESPEVGFVGCEPFINGVASLLKHIDTKSIENVRIVVDDARLLLKGLPTACVNRIYILFPDPWHKKRHHKRRIVSDETIGDLSRILKTGGTLYLATDILNYAEWMQETLATRPEFSLEMGDRKSLTDRPTDWPEPTKYELKGVQAGRHASYMIYRKKMG